MGGSGSGRPKKPFLDTYKGQSKNTWTRYIKDVGMVCAEAMKRDRRNPANKYVNAQVDESTMEDRKCKRGKRVRKVGVQWALSCVEVDPDDGRTVALSIYNSCLTTNETLRTSFHC